MITNQCPACKASIPPNPNPSGPVLFCPSCGTSLSGSIEPPKPPSSQVPPPVVATVSTSASPSGSGRSRPRLILMGFLWSAAIYFLGSILMVTMVIASGGKGADDTPMAIKSAFIVIALTTLLSPLVVIWLTAKGALPGTRKA